MHQRKLQNIAGMTYTVSLPKEWVLRNSLQKKSTVTIEENGDGTLSISPNISRKPAKDSISFNIGEQEGNISHILYATYYMGYENVRLFSKKDIPLGARNKIKKTIQNLSGVEIVYEDLNRIDMKVLLDISKTNINQLLFRINLLIGASIENITNSESLQDLARNEDEIDRLHHLVQKMAFISSCDSSILKNSGMKNAPHILSYSLISKKMENMADSLSELGEYLDKPDKKKKGDQDRPKMASILLFFKERCSRDTNLLVKEALPPEHVKDMTEIGKITNDISAIADPNIRMMLSNISHAIIDIEEEMMNLMYYKRLTEESVAEGKQQ